VKERTTAGVETSRQNLITCVELVPRKTRITNRVEDSVRLDFDCFGLIG
jgi:hypothetical protein